MATPTRLRNHPQLLANGFLLEQQVDGIEGPVPYMAFPFHMSNHPQLSYRPAPKVGEHTEEILGGLLGLSREDLADLRKSGVI